MPNPEPPFKLKGKPMERIPSEELPKLVGKSIHLMWAKKGCVWKLVKINPDGTILVMTPVGGKFRTAKACDACYTERHRPRNE